MGLGLTEPVTVHGIDENHRQEFLKVCGQVFIEKLDKLILIHRTPAVSINFREESGRERERESTPKAEGGVVRVGPRATNAAALACYVAHLSFFSSVHSRSL